MSLYIVAEGDSLTAGVPLTLWNRPFNQMALLYTDERMVSVANHAIAGSQVVGSANDMTARAALVDAEYDSRKGKNILWCWCGTNDMASLSSTPEVTYANYAAYCAARKAVGFLVVAVTVLPRNASGNFDTRRQTFNASVRANYLTFAHALADMEANPTIGPAAACFDMTYYQADNIHLTQAGYAIVATIAKAAIDSLL